MPVYFADTAVQQTTGPRGKTTRRRATRTVRGSEGAWIAQAKDELGPLVAVELPGWRVRQVAAWKGGPAEESFSHVFARREDAEADLGRARAWYADPAEAKGWVLVAAAVEPAAYTRQFHANLMAPVYPA